MDIYRRMEEVFRRIPDGCVTTYGQVALLCGAPRHSRQVGYALRTNRLGEPKGGWHIEEAMTREEALRSFTNWSAYA